MFLVVRIMLGRVQIIQVQQLMLSIRRPFQRVRRYLFAEVMTCPQLLGHPLSVLTPIS